MIYIIKNVKTHIRLNFRTITTCHPFSNAKKNYELGNSELLVPVEIQVGRVTSTLVRELIEHFLEELKNKS